MKYLVGACVLILILFAYYQSHSAVQVGPTRAWNVLSKYDNKKEAAELLSRTNARMITFLRALKAKYHIDEPADVHIADDHRTIMADRVSPAIGLARPTYAMIDFLLDNYNPDVFYENEPGRGETSYTVRKGAAMYICLRQKDNPTKLVDENDLLFVMLHESAHIANHRGWGHEQDFWSAFKFILREAQLAGVYTPVDYSKHPINYCGLDVAYNPLYDNTLPDLA